MVEFFGGTPSAVNVNPVSGKTSSSLQDSDFLGDAARYKVVTQNGRQYVADVNGNQFFVIVTGSGKNIKYQVTDDLTKAQAAYIKEFSGGLPALKKALLNSGYITKDEYANNNYISGLISAISDLSIQSVQGYAYESKTEFKPMSSFLAGQKGTGTTSKAGTFKDTTTDITTIGDAYKEINDYMLDVFGREATQEEKDTFYKDINARELKSGVQTVTVRDATGKITKTQKIGAALTSDERINSLNAVVKTALKGTEAETILSSSKGSKIAQDIAKIQKSAANYGQPMSAGQAMKYVLDGFGTPDYVAKQTERLRLNAMTMFGNLKDHIQNGGNVKDIADQYAYIKSKKLGIALTDSMADKDVVDAISKTGGLMSTADFSRQMQANPLWRQTEEAHNTAADFANTILKSFGFMG
jgi:hypothetical protein